MWLQPLASQKCTASRGQSCRTAAEEGTADLDAPVLDEAELPETCSRGSSPPPTGVRTHPRQPCPRHARQCERTRAERPVLREPGASQPWCLVNGANRESVPF